MKMKPEVRIPILGNIVECVLTKFSKCREIAASLKERAMLLLLSAKGATDVAVAKQINKHPDTVSLWRKRYIQCQDKIEEFAEEGKEKDLESFLISFLISFLSDAPRSGKPRKFDDNVRSQITGFLYREPKDFGYEDTSWSLPLLRRVTIEQGIVPDISTGALHRIRTSANMKPWQNHYYLHSAEKYEDPTSYKDKIYAVNFAYLLSRYLKGIKNSSNFNKKNDPYDLKLKIKKVLFTCVVNVLMLCKLNMEDLKLLLPYFIKYNLPCDFLNVQAMNTPRKKLLPWQKMKVEHAFNRLRMSKEVQGSLPRSPLRVYLLRLSSL